MISRVQLKGPFLPALPDMVKVGTVLDHEESRADNYRWLVIHDLLSN